MKILVTGLTTLHWGRLEYGNIGNYYIIVPFFRNLHRAFPDAEISTTLQFSDAFLKAENIRSLPLDYYYSWRQDHGDLKEALREYAIAELFSRTGKLHDTTPFLEEVRASDLVLFFHGDMWGDNADFAGEKRFAVDLLKTRAAQLLGKKTVMLASSPGPVTDPEWLDLAQETFKKFDLVANREAQSKILLEKSGFDVSRTSDFACPAYLFSPSYYPHPVNPAELYAKAQIPLDKKVKNIGLIPATYSLPDRSFDQWEHDDSDFSSFIELIEHIISKYDVNVILISHSNGFEITPSFKRIHWRDYKMVCTIYEIIKRRNKVDMRHLFKLDLLLYPWEMHAFIGELDMLISGRVHGSVAGLNQTVPTMAIDYKNGPLAHKMFGFFDVIKMGNFVVPREDNDFVSFFDTMYQDLQSIRLNLQRNLPQVQASAIAAFDQLKEECS